MIGRLRVEILRKIARLGDRYFSSRLSSDMAERAHAMHVLRNVPGLLFNIARVGFAIVFTTAGIAWLSPVSAGRALLLAALALLVPVGCKRLLTAHRVAAEALSLQTRPSHRISDHRTLRLLGYCHTHQGYVDHRSARAHGRRSRTRAPCRSPRCSACR